MELIELPQARYKLDFKSKWSSLSLLIEYKMKEKNLRPADLARLSGMDNGGFSRFRNSGRGMNAKNLLSILKILDNITIEELRDL